MADLSRKRVLIDIENYESAGDDNGVLSYALDDISNRISADKIFDLDVEYVLKLKSKQYFLNRTLFVRDLSNVILDGNGATLAVTSFVSAMKIQNCSAFTVSNLSFDYNPLPFLQGTVVDVSDCVYTVGIDDGYSDDVSILNQNETIYMNIHDSNSGAFLEDTSVDYSVKNVRKSEDGFIKFDLFGSFEKVRAPITGDAISLYQRGADTVRIQASEDITFFDVNIFSSPGFALTDLNSYGGTKMKNCNIIPGPKPIGARKSRIKSCNGDATHFMTLKKGPVIENCRFTHCGDDCINIHGFFLYVVDVNDKEILVSPKFFAKFDVGEQLCFFKKNTFLRLGTAKITDFKEIHTDKYSDVIKELWKNTIGNCLSVKRLYSIKLDRVVDELSQGDILYSLDTVGNGSVIKNNYFGLNRARGIVFKGTNGTIENNTVTGCSKAAIMVAADMEWAEAGFADNLVIKNNIIKNCAIDKQAKLGDRYTVGSIMVMLQSFGGFKKCFNYENIIIENNTVEDSGVYGIFVSNANKVTVNNNKVINPFKSGINEIASWYNIKPKSGIFIGESTNASESDNSVINKSDDLSIDIEIR